MIKQYIHKHNYQMPNKELPLDNIAQAINLSIQGDDFSILGLRYA